MLRKPYHIRIEYTGLAELDSALRLLGRNPNSITQGCKDGIQPFEYFVDLSKYELLFLQHTCTSGKILKIKRECSNGHRKV